MNGDRRRRWKWLIQIARYLASYLLGVGLAVAVTPAELVLAGVGIWPSYLVLGFPGTLAFYFYIPPLDSWGAGYWLTYLIGLLPLLLPLVVRLPVARPLRRWHPLWIGFPIGFVGTVGVYYTAAASI